MDSFTLAICSRESERVPLEVFAPSQPEQGKRQDDVEGAIALILNAGQVFRDLKADCQSALERASGAATIVEEKLDETIVRAGFIEVALHRAESKNKEVIYALEQAEIEISRLNTQLASLEQLLHDATQRAEVAEKRMEETKHTIKRILTTIRSGRAVDHSHASS